jgi:hypothetical protein
MPRGDRGYREGMSRRGRWGLVAAGVLVLLAAPFVVRAWPVPSSPMTAVEVVERVRAARGLAWSGTVKTRGDIGVPSRGSLSDVAELLGRDTTLRAWWQDARTWRVATLRPTGETDLFHRASGLVRWVYEARQVTRVPDRPVRLPRSADLLPPVLAVQVLDGARTSELARLPTRRVAGRTTVGVRLSPESSQSTVEHVDVWADEDSGLPLRVEVYADRESPSLVTSFVELDLGAPEPGLLRFDPPPGTREQEDYADSRAVDVATAADRYSDRVAPEKVAGMPRIRKGLGPVGVYGRGPTLVLALPLLSGDAEELRSALRTQGGTCLAQGDGMTSGPVSLFLTRRRFADQWLLMGTVTLEAMARDASQLPAGVGDQLAGQPTRTEPCT